MSKANSVFRGFAVCAIIVCLVPRETAGNMAVGPQTLTKEQIEKPWIAPDEFTATRTPKIDDSSPPAGVPAVSGPDSPNIVGGGEVTPTGKYPWQAQIIAHISPTTDKLCGGSLVANRWILTAGHCTYNSFANRYFDISEYVVRLGTHTRSPLSSGAITRGVSQVVRGSYDYQQNNKEYDIALLRLDSPVEVGSGYGVGVDIINLAGAPAGDELSGEIVVISGWGNTASGQSDSTSNVLREASITVISNSDFRCAQWFNALSGVSDYGKFCAAELNLFGINPVLPCYGDSGGPAVRYVSGRWELAGVASFGPTNCDPNLSGLNAPAVFTKVPTYRSWIFSNIAGSVRGIVRDSRGSPVSGATVSLLANYRQQSTITNVDGQYAFAEVIEGAYSVVATLDYAPKMVTAYVYPSQVNFIDDIVITRQCEADGTCNTSDGVAILSSPNLNPTANPGQALNLSWTFKNIGTTNWSNYHFERISGNALGAQSSILLPTTGVLQNAGAQLSWMIPSNTAAGRYVSQYQLRNASGIGFGPIIDLAITVNVNVNTPTPQPQPPVSAWAETYYNSNDAASGYCGSRSTNDVYFFRDSDGGWSPPSGCPSAGSLWSMRAERTLYFAEDDYEFGLFDDDDAKVYVDNILVADDWNATVHYGGIHLAAGNHTVRLHYRNNAGRAMVQLWWRGAGFLPKGGQTPQPNEWWTSYFGNRGGGDGGSDPVASENAGTGIVNRQFGYDGPGFGIPPDQFSLRFSRHIAFNCGIQRFEMASDDGYRLKINGVTVQDRWTSGVWNDSVDVSLPGGYHDVSLEYFENAGAANISMSWSELAPCTATPTPTSTPTATPRPTATPYPCPAISAWRGEYWNSLFNYGSRALCRDDANINFAWGSGSPGIQVTPDGFSSQWSRQMQFDDALYRFDMTHDDGAELLIDGVSVYQNYCQNCVVQQSVYVPLGAGIHSVVFRAIEVQGGASAGLIWTKIPHTPTPTLTRTPTPTPTPTRTPTPAALADLDIYDLLITSNNGNVLIGSPVTVTVRVRNNSNQAIYMPFDVDLYVDHAPQGCADYASVKYWTIPSIPAGQILDRTYVYSGFTSLGLHQFYVGVDTGCTILESYENNNSLGISFIVVTASSTPTPTPTPTSQSTVPHDDFDNPVIITSTAFTAQIGTGGATSSPDDPELTDCNRRRGNATVWYRYTPSTNGIISVDTIGSNYDTMLAIWTGTRGSLVSRGCNDDISGPILQSSLAVTVLVGIPYYIEVAQYSSTATNASGAEGNSPTLDTPSVGGSLALHFSFSPYRAFVPIVLRAPPALCDSFEPNNSRATVLGGQVTSGASYLAKFCGGDSEDNYRVQKAVAGSLSFTLTLPSTLQGHVVAYAYSASNLVFTLESCTGMGMLISSAPFTASCTGLTAGDYVLRLIMSQEGIYDDINPYTFKITY